MKTPIEVAYTVSVEVPDGFFTDDFMKEFRESFYEFYTVEQHMQHLAQLYVRGLAHNDSFIEGYGDARELGIKFEGL